MARIVVGRYSLDDCGSLRSSRGWARVSRACVIAWPQGSERFGGGDRRSAIEVLPHGRHFAGLLFCSVASRAPQGGLDGWSGCFWKVGAIGFCILSGTPVHTGRVKAAPGALGGSMSVPGTYLLEVLLDRIG